MSTKQKILQTAVRLSGEEGLHALNARVIAKEMGITSSNVFYHFKTQEVLKQAVYAQVMESATRYVEMQMRAVASEDPLQNLKAYCEGTLKWGVERPDEIRFFLHGIVEGGQGSESSQYSKKSLSNGLGSLVNLVSLVLIALKKTAYKKDSTELLAKHIHSLLIGTTLRLYLFQHDRENFEALSRSLWQTIETTLESL